MYLREKRVGTICQSSQQPMSPDQSSQPWATGAAAISTLTPQQKRVLDCVGEGLSNAAIADRVGIVVSTVKGHICAVFDRLGCSNRTEAALIALRYRNGQFKG